MFVGRCGVGGDLMLKEFVNRGLNDPIGGKAVLFGYGLKACEVFGIDANCYSGWLFCLCGRAHDSPSAFAVNFFGNSFSGG